MKRSQTVAQWLVRGFLCVMALGWLAGCSQEMAATGADGAKGGSTYKQQGATLNNEDQAIVAKVAASGMSPNHLAGIHKQKLSMECTACHSDTLVPDSNASVENARCEACHGSYDKLAAASKAKSKNPDINPHGSHLGPEIACTTCHRGHEESIAYCSYCHSNFNLPIPGGVATVQDSKEKPFWKK